MFWEPEAFQFVESFRINHFPGSFAHFQFVRNPLEEPVVAATDAVESFQEAAIRHGFKGFSDLMGSGWSTVEVVLPNGVFEVEEVFNAGISVGELGKKAGLLRRVRGLGLQEGPATLVEDGEFRRGEDVEFGVKPVGSGVGGGVELATVGDGAASFCADAAGGFALGVGDGALEESGAGGCGSGHIGGSPD